MGWCDDRLAPLAGYAIGITADRRRVEQAELLRRWGASVVLAPALRTVPLADDSETVAATRALIREPPEYLVATTGVGTRMWFAAAQAAGIDEELRVALAQTRVIARGPKCRGALHQLDLPPWRSEPTELLDGAVAHMLSLGVERATVAVQLYGNCVPAPLTRLEEHGARIVGIPVYTWGIPDDHAPLAGLVKDVVHGRLSAVTFTSAPAINAAFDTAVDLGLGDRLLGAFNSSAIAAAVGPRTATVLRERGVDAPCFPEQGRLGLMVRALAKRLRTDHRHLVTGAGVEVVIQGSCVADGTRVVELSPREHQIFRVLADHPRRVAPRSLLLRDVWGRDSVEPAAVDTVVHRLRQRLRPLGLDIRFVARRGWALDADLASCVSTR